MLKIGGVSRVNAADDRGVGAAQSAVHLGDEGFDVRFEVLLNPLHFGEDLGFGPPAPPAPRARDTEPEPPAVAFRERRDRILPAIPRIVEVVPVLSLSVYSATGNNEV